jgi:hypothetical protein
MTWPTQIRTYRDLRKINVRAGDVPRGVSLINGKVGGNYSLDPAFKFTEKRDFDSVIESLALPGNLAIIKREVEWMVARRSLATSPSLLCALEVYYAGELLLRTMTAKSVLLAVLTREIKPASLVILKTQLEHVHDIVTALIPHSLGSVTQYMSDIRVRVLRPNLGLELIAELNKNAIFQQPEVDKAAVRAKQRAARIRRATHQIHISTKDLVSVGARITKNSLQITRDHAIHHFRIYNLHTLLMTVMLATGSRLTEVLILSDYIETPPDAPIVKRSLPGSNFLTISPVAKRKDPTTIKTSDRVILFGLTLANIKSMVQTIRVLAAGIQENRTMYTSLDKNNQHDRAKAIRMISDYSGFVTDVLYNINRRNRFIPRSLRGLYAVLSYKEKAIKPTSEIVWINTLLGHALMSTSVHYNVYSLY